MKRVLSALITLAVASSALGELTIIAREVGNDVVITATGSLDLTGWDGPTEADPALPYLANASIITGLPALGFGLEQVGDRYRRLLGCCPSFGTGFPETFADSNSGDDFYFQFNFHESTIVVPAGYQFGDSIQAEMVFRDESFKSLEVDPFERNGLRRGDARIVWTARQTGCLLAIEVIGKASFKLAIDTREGHVRGPERKAKNFVTQVLTAERPTILFCQIQSLLSPLAGPRCSAEQTG